MKSEEEWMIQWTNVNQNLIDALVFFKWKWGFLYQIDLDSRGKLLALFLWTELTEMYEKKSNFTTGKELRNWLSYIGNQTKILITHFPNEVWKSGRNATAVQRNYKEFCVL